MLGIFVSHYLIANMKKNTPGIKKVITSWLKGVRKDDCELEGRSEHWMHLGDISDLSILWPYRFQICWLVMSIGGPDNFSFVSHFAAYCCIARVAILISIKLVSAAVDK